jgi:hypothetical protein
MARALGTAALGAFLLVAAAAASGDGAGAPPIEVFGPHNRVLLAWLAAARDGRLPREGVTLVHIDAHADLAVPQGPLAPGFPASDEALLARTHIASFVLAAVRAGLVDEVVWIHPAWSSQLPDGAREFRLGALADGSLAVDDPSDFYVLDAGFAPTAALRQVQTVTLRALPLGEASRSTRIGDGPTILDVDLDVFATHNPAADRLRAAGLGDADLERLRATFAPEALGLAADPPARRAEVEALEGAIGALAGGRVRALPAAALVFWQRGIGPGDLWALSGMLDRVQGPGVEALLEQGRLVIGLPERRADPAEIADTARRIAALVGEGVVRPSLVTVARSVDDGYTPRAAWPLIEWSLLVELARVLPDSRVRFDSGLGPAPRPAAWPGAGAIPRAPARAR